MKNTYKYKFAGIAEARTSITLAAIWTLINPYGYNSHENKDLYAHRRSAMAARAPSVFALALKIATANSIVETIKMAIFLRVSSADFLRIRTCQVP